jgi:hypothetical protein
MNKMDADKGKTTVEETLKQLKEHSGWLILGAFLIPGILLGIGFVLSWGLEIPILVNVSGCLAIFAFIWSWGVFLTAFWFGPRGSLHPQTICRLPNGTRWIFKTGRYAAILFLALWFLFPIIIVLMVFGLLEFS